MSQIRLKQRYTAIQELHEEERISIVALCKIAKISRAAYYKWLNRKVSTRETENFPFGKVYRHSTIKWMGFMAIVVSQ